MKQVRLAKEGAENAAVSQELDRATEALQNAVDSLEADEDA